MKKTTALVFSAILFLGSVSAQPSHAQVILNNGVLDLQGTFGNGSNTSYFIVDFGGGPVSATGPRDSYAFGYQWDAANTTAADGLLEIASASPFAIDTIDFGGSLGLGINTLSFGEDTDTPIFNDDDRFWNFFVGTLDNGIVEWSFSAFGISGGPENPDGSLPGELTDGAFLGFRAQVFGSGEPVLPVIAIPEPSTVLLFGFASLAGGALRRRKA